ncbi:hypothetical protein OOJ96_10695 [Pseudomonas sp. 15FMM2]|uniref:Uncharacterized protein n=1 Tax=Pseudomonas imrae TaxID=2992837 RepID=A0ACC7PCY7_9PSED
MEAFRNFDGNPMTINSIQLKSSPQTSNNLPVSAQGSAMRSVETAVTHTSQSILNDTPYSQGDSTLAELYARKLREGVKEDLAVNFIAFEFIETPPQDSLFWQWRTHLHNIIKSPDFNAWAAENRVDLSKDIVINQSLGIITCTASGVKKHFEVANDASKSLAPIWPMLKGAAKALAPSGGSVSAGQKSIATLSEIARFYREDVSTEHHALLTDDDKKKLEQQALKLETHKTFNNIDSQHSEAFLEQGRRKLADVSDRRRATPPLLTVATSIAKLADELESRQRQSIYGVQRLTPELAQEQLDNGILSALENTHFTPAPHSSCSQSNNLVPGASASLKEYLTANGLDIPKSFLEIMNLGEYLRKDTPGQALHGNLGGALSWPIPLTDQERLNVRYAILGNTLGLATLTHYDSDKEVLGYLGQGFRVEPRDLANPRRVINNLLDTPKAKALGLALQNKFDAIATDTSIDDWTLAAIGASLDRETTQGSTLAPVRTGVGGFDLARSEQWGKPVSDTVEELIIHLIDKKKASPRLARLAAYILLSLRAPAFLVKDIPRSVTYGSHTWVTFTTAVARIEAQAPGATSGMTFGDVMARASLAPVTAADRQVEYDAQQDALKDWGVANGLIPLNTLDVYDTAQMNTVHDAFNTQVAELSAASQAQETPIPTRRELALKYLKAHYGEHIDFEKRCISPDSVGKQFPGPYSIVDLYMKGFLGNPPGDFSWASSSADVHINSIDARAHELPNIQAVFDKELPDYFKKMENSIATQTKLLISQLPLEDRKRFEYGGIRLAKSLTTHHTIEKREPTNSYGEHVLLINTTLNGTEKNYKVDLKQNSITPIVLDSDFITGVKSHGGYRPYTELQAITPRGNYTANIAAESNSRGLTPNSFSSERTQYIADALVEEMNLNDLKDQAQGLTTFDTEEPFYLKAREFMLNLIPLRSAIQNFQKGNIGEGFVDLALDVFGFVVGVGAAAKGAKALKAGASAGQKLTHAARIMGRAAIGSLNPVSGLDDVVVGLARGTVRGGNTAIKNIRQISGAAESYDLLAASKRFEASSVGTFKLNDEILEAPAIFERGKWYSYDFVTSQPFGKPLDNFTPSLRVSAQDLAKWENITSPKSQKTIDIERDWATAVHKKRDGTEKIAFERGYNSGNVHDIPGFSQKMKSEELMALAKNESLTSEQLGALVKQRENIAFEAGATHIRNLYNKIDPSVSTLIPMPQVSYLALTSQLSGGQCAGLSRAMASAVAEGKELNLINNMYTAAAYPAAPASQSFMKTLSNLHDQVTGASAFHVLQPQKQVSYLSLIDELGSAQASKTFMIEFPGHAMTGGVKFEGANKTFFFYDPNFGLIKFKNMESMKLEMSKIFNDKKLGKQYKTHSVDPHKLEFKVSEYNNSWKKTTGNDNAAFEALYKEPLPAPATSVNAA